MRCKQEIKPVFGDLLIDVNNIGGQVPKKTFQALLLLTVENGADGPRRACKGVSDLEPVDRGEITNGSRELIQPLIFGQQHVDVVTTLDKTLRKEFQIKLSATARAGA
jgi:hypothetical protein